MAQFCKPIYLRPDQVELTIMSLQFLKLRLDQDGTSSDRSHAVAAKFTHRRIDDVILVLNKVMPTPPKQERP